MSSGKEGSGGTQINNWQPHRAPTKEPPKAWRIGTRVNLLEIKLITDPAPQSSLAADLERISLSSGRKIWSQGTQSSGTEAGDGDPASSSGRHRRRLDHSYQAAELSSSRPVMFGLQSKRWYQQGRRWGGEGFSIFHQLAECFNHKHTLHDCGLLNKYEI